MLSVFTTGTHRDEVLAEMGQPTATETNDNGFKYDIFTFRQGQHGGVKAGKAVAYGFLAFASLGVSEIVTSPIEGANKGAEMKIKATYDESKQVSVVDVMHDGRWIPVQEIEDTVKEEQLADSAAQ